jgi:hypothetical protein
MSVDAATLTELRRLEATMSPDADSGLQALGTVEAVYGWLITLARQNGDDEGDMCELLASHSGAPPSEVRAIASVLRRLGYVVASDRLRQIAGRRRHDLRPL